MGETEPLTTRQKALLLGSPCVAGLLGAFVWWLVDQLRWDPFKP